MIGHYGASIGSLRNYIKIIVIWDYICRYDSSGWYISDVIALCEESFWGLDVDHDHGKGRKGFWIWLKSSFLHRCDIEFMEETDLIPRCRMMEDNHLSWHRFVSLEIGLKRLQCQTYHKAKLLLGFSESFASAKYGSEGWIQSRTHAKSSLASFSSIKGDHHRVW